MKTTIPPCRSARLDPRRPIHRAFTIVLIAAACLVSSSHARAADETDALQRRVAELEAQLAERDARIAILEAEVAAYAGQLANVETRQAQLDQREADLEVMAGAVATGELAELYDTQIKVTQDEERGRTVVSAGPEPVVEEALTGDFFISAVYSIPADQPGGVPESVSLFVQGAFSGGQFDGLEEMTFQVADEPLTVPVANYRHVMKRSGLAGKNRSRRGDETVTFVLDVPTVRRLAEATSLTLQTPKGPLTLGREHRALLRALLMRMGEPQRTGNPGTTHGD